MGISESIRRAATDELSKESTNSNINFILGGGMPLFAAILLLLIPTSDTAVWTYDLRVLTAMMIVSGTVGFVLAIFAAQRIAKAKEAYLLNE